MSSSTNDTVLPAWPALSLTQDYYLNTTYESWYFVTVWSMVLTTIVYGLASLRASFVFRKTLSGWALGIPFLFTFLGALSGFFAGSILGIVLGVLYDTGGFRMSAWIAMLWSLLQALILILSSFSKVTTLL